MIDGKALGLVTSKTHLEIQEKSPKIMIQAVIFDLGNVILPVDESRLVKRLSAYTSFSQEKILDIIKNKLNINDYETGSIPSQDFYRQLCDLLKLENLSYADFTKIFNDIFTTNEHIVSLIKGLKSRYKMGLVSNTNEIHVDHLKKTYTDLFNQFDELLFSNEVGLRKPDPAIYHLALKRLNVQPHEAVFIDDLKPNVTSATDVGIHGVLFQPHNNLSADLNELGVKA